MKATGNTFRRFDRWFSCTCLIVLAGYIVWQSLKDGIDLYQFLFYTFVFSPAFIFLIFDFLRATERNDNKRRAWLYFYLLVTRQSKRLILEKLKDSVVRFSDLDPKWRDDEDIVYVAVHQDLNNLNCCSERYRGDLEFIVAAYNYHNQQSPIKLTSIRDAYFTFLHIQSFRHQLKGFFWGVALVKFFNKPDREFDTERSFAESLFEACAKNAEWFDPTDRINSLTRLEDVHQGFSKEIYTRVFESVCDLNRTDPPDWIW